MEIVLEKSEDIKFWKKVYIVSVKANKVCPETKADEAVKDLWRRLSETDQSSEKNIPVLGKKNAQFEKISILDIDEDLLPMFEDEYNWLQCWKCGGSYTEFMNRIVKRIKRGEYCGATTKSILGEAHKYWYSASKPANIKGIDWDDLYVAVYGEISGEPTLDKFYKRMQLRDEYKALSNSEAEFMNITMKQWWQESTGRDE